MGPVEHDSARLAVQRIADRAKLNKMVDDDFKVLTQYLAEREQASRDFKATLEAVVQMLGPDGLIEVKRFVESSRTTTVLHGRKN